MTDLDDAINGLGADDVPSADDLLGTASSTVNGAVSTATGAVTGAVNTATQTVAGLTNLNLNTLAQSGGLTASVNSAVGLLSPAQQAAINAQLQTEAAQYGPAIKLAQQVAAAASSAATDQSGGIMTMTKVAAALTSAATMFAGPVAGAAMAAMGALWVGAATGVEGLFGALGLYGPPAPEYAYQGLTRVPNDSKAWGTGSPNWIDVSTWAKFKAFYYGPPGGDANHPPISGALDTWTVNLLSAALTQVLATPDQVAQVAYGLASAKGLNPPLYVAATRFERYFLPLLIANLQQWANAAPCLPPRSLLVTCVQAWNNQVGSEKTVTFSAIDTQGNEGQPVVGVILGGGGDPSGNFMESPPIVVNDGAAIPLIEIKDVLTFAPPTVPITPATSQPFWPTIAYFMLGTHQYTDPDDPALKELVNGWQANGVPLVQAVAAEIRAQGAMVADGDASSSTNGAGSTLANMMAMSGIQILPAPPLPPPAGPSSAYGVTSTTSAGSVAAVAVVVVGLGLALYLWKGNRSWH